MDFKEYQQKAYTSIGNHDNEKDRMANWTQGLSGEVGEVNELVKHHYYGAERISTEKLAKELGDVLWYLSAIATHFNLDLDSCAQLNIAKLQHRHGSDSFSMLGSLTRHEKEKDFKNTTVYEKIMYNINNCPVTESNRNRGYKNGEGANT